MFNLKKWVKSLFSENSQVKTASLAAGLEQHRKDQGTQISDTPEITEGVLDRAESYDKDATIESKMNKENKSDSQTLEAQMEDKLKYSIRKNDNIRDEVPRINVAVEMHDQAYREAYTKAEKNLNKQKDLFEKYIGKKGSKQVPGNVPNSASGLVNSPDRFVNFDGVPTEDVKKNLSNIEESSSVKSMHTIADLDSVKKLDAAAFYVAYKAASSGRDLNDEENTLIESIINKKRELLNT